LSALLFKSLMIASSEAFGARVLDFLALTAFASFELSFELLPPLHLELFSKSLSESDDFLCLDDFLGFDFPPLLLPDLEIFLLDSTSLSESDLLRLRDLLSFLLLELDFRSFFDLETFFLTSTSLSDPEDLLRFFDFFSDFFFDAFASGSSSEAEYWLCFPDLLSDTFALPDPDPLLESDLPGTLKLRTILMLSPRALQIRTKMRTISMSHITNNVARAFSSLVMMGLMLTTSAWCLLMGMASLVQDTRWLSLVKVMESGEKMWD